MVLLTEESRESVLGLLIDSCKASSHWDVMKGTFSNKFVTLSWTPGDQLDKHSWDKKDQRAKE